MTTIRLVPRRHWTPAYLLARTRDIAYRRRHPSAPWLTPAANRFLDQWLRTAALVVEFGSGRSTSWIAARADTVLSIESDRTWYERVRKNLSSFPKASVVLADHSTPSTYLQEADEALADRKPDAIVDDGKHRDAVALWSLRRLAAGGILVIDDVHRYLPSDSRAPGACRHQPANEDWTTFAYRTRRWSRLWTSDGVSDTLVLFAPASSRS